MAWFRLTNYSAVPINAQVSWARFSEMYKNNIPPAVTDDKGQVISRGYAEWNVGGAAWHDLKVVPRNLRGDNDFDGHNAEAITTWVIGGAGVIAAGASIILIPFTAGAAAPLAAAEIAAVAAAIGGGVVATATVVLEGVQIALKPVTVGNLYAPDGYNFEVWGGQPHYTTDPSSGITTITGFSQLTVKWHNNQTGAHGSVTA